MNTYSELKNTQDLNAAFGELLELSEKGVDKTNSGRIEKLYHLVKSYNLRKKKSPWTFAEPSSN